MENNICHVEIPIKNVISAEKFYNSLFNWNIDFTLLEDYGLLNKNDISIGFPLRENFTPNNGIIYIKVDDINKYLKKALENGGKLHKEKGKISDQIGYSASFIDIFGNKIGLFSTHK